MHTIDFLRQFLDDLRVQRLRTTLTILGIAWGTVAVVALLAFGTGLQEQMQATAKGIGDGIVILFGGRTSRSFQGFPEGRWIQLREEDALILERQIPDIAAISPEYGRRAAPVRRGTASTTPYITGIYPVYGEMRNIIPEPGGRFINEPDLAQRRRVVVLGDEIKRLLFGDEPAVGEQVLIGEVPFTVVGVMRHKTQNSSYNSRDQDRIFIPASTYRALFGDRYLNNIVYMPRDPDLAEPVKRQVYEVLGRRHRFDPEDDDALGVWDINQQMRFFKYLFLGFNLFLGVVGSFTLLVGGIGVANIMYIVVRERTREIGIKRSIGARKRHILGQFLAETFLIVAAGGVLGFLVSFALVKAASLLPIQEAVGTPTLSLVIVGATILLLGAIALLAGLFPARRAANLDPVECLRY
jgi:putative ABC transport system permease protein